MYHVTVDTFMVFGLRKQLILKLAVGGERRSSLLDDRALIHPVLLTRPKRLNWGIASNELSTGNAPPCKTSDAPSKSSSSVTIRNSTQTVHREKLQYLYRLTFWVKVVIVCSFLSLVTVVVAFIVYCRLEVEFVHSLFTLVADFQLIEVWTLKAGIVARDVAMLEAGVPYNETEVRLRAGEAGETLKEMAEEARSQLAVHPDLWASVEHSDNLWWEYEENRFLPRHKNLLDTLESLSSLSFALSKPDSSPTTSQQLTLYRNADTETFIYIDRKYRQLVDRGKVAMAANGPMIVLLLCVSEVVVICEVCM